MGNIDRIKVDVLIPVHNEEKFLGLCLKYLRKQRLLNNIIVLDDFSTDHSVAIAKKYDAKVIKAQKPIDQRDSWASEVLNYGLKFIKTKYFLKIDADIIVLKDYIYNCVKYIEKNKKIYSVSGVVPPIYPNWFKTMNIMYQLSPRGGARLYNIEILKKIGGFSHENKVSKDSRRNILTKRSEDIITDNLALKFNFFRGLSRKAKGWHLRPAQRHIEINKSYLYEKMFFLLLFLRFKEFQKGISLIRNKIQQSNLKELLSKVITEIKSLLSRLFTRIIESEEIRFWIRKFFV